MINHGIFREYDIRGIVDKDLTTESVTLLAKGFGTYFVQKGCKAVSLGRDVRLSGKRFRDIMATELINAGLHVIDLGEVTTPMSYYSTFTMPIDGGVMITGSHNPSDYNGFKISLGKTTIFGEEIQNIYKIIESKNFAVGKGSLVEQNIRATYLDDVVSRIKLGKKIKVVIDSGNATGGIIAPEFYNRIGCEVIELYSEPDGRFPNHHPDPTVDANLKVLIETVKKTGADVGIGFDGDSDRIGAVDNKGNIIRGDKLLAILARDVLSRNPGEKIVFDVKCSQGLIEDIEAHGGVPVMWKTGHSLIKNKMKEINGLVAGEMSGHIFMGDGYFGYDDAIFDGARLIQIISNTDKQLSEIHESIPSYFSTPETRLDVVNDQVKFEMVKKAIVYFKANHEVIDIDGVRVLFGDGWGLIRASNTQPVIVVRFEARSENRMHEIQDLMLGKLREYGEFTLSAGH